MPLAAVFLEVGGCGNEDCFSKEDCLISYSIYVFIWPILPAHYFKLEKTNNSIALKIFKIIQGK